MNFTLTLTMILLLDSYGGFPSLFAHRVCLSGLAIVVVCILHMTLGGPLVLSMADCLRLVEYCFKTC